MKPRDGTPASLPSPLRLFLTVLAISFLAEAAVMLFLPLVLPHMHGVVPAIMDAVLLTLLSAPFLWWVVVRPLRSTAMVEHMRAATVISRALIGFITINAHGLVLSLNPAAERLFGYGIDEMAGQPLTLLMPERYREAHRRGLERLRSTGKSDVIGKTIELHGRRKDGSEFPLELALATWQAGTDTCYTGIVRDVTERKRAEENIRNLMAEQQSILENTTVGIAFVKDRRIVRCNPALAAIFGYRVDELIGRSTRPLHISEEAYEARGREAYPQVEMGGSYVTDTQHKRRDGTVFWVNTTLTALDRSDLSKGVIWVVQDIDQRKRAEEALAARTRQLEAVRAVTAEISRELDLTTVLDVIMRRAMKLVGAASGTVFLWDEEAQVLVPKAWHGFSEWRAAMRLRLGEGVGGAVALHREGMIINDYRTSPYAHPLAIQNTSISAVLAEPLLYRDRLVGVINLDKEGPGESFCAADREILALFAAQAAIAIENARLHVASVRRGDEPGALLRAARSVMSDLDLQEILDRILTEATQISGCSHVKVLLLDKEAGVLRVGGLKGTAAMSAGDTLPLGIGASGIVAMTGQPLYIEDTPNDPRNPYAQRDRELGVVTYLGLPIRIREEVIGVLSFNTTSPRHYTPDELAYLASFADHAAIAIENARLYVAIQQHAATLEVRVRERTAELEEALRVKAQFLANMSHELRTPLNFILGFTQLHQQGTAGPLTSKQAHYLDHIHAGGKRLFDLVTDMLDLSQGKTGKKDFHLEPVLLGPMVEELLGMVRVQAAQKRLTVSTALHPGLPFVVADRAKLTQILANLIGNAVKFTPEGGHITLRAYQKAESTKQTAGDEQQAADASVLPSAGCLLPSVVIEVEDTGIGIKPEDLERIFQYFEQVDSSDTRKYDGAGLGLALVRTLVELHGGRVWAESEGEGHGARFVVRLPHLEALRRKRVMLVADEAPILESLDTVLGGAGYAVEPAPRSGAQALAALDANPPDLLVLDIGLPGGDGWEILRQVRESEATRALPVLVLTGPDQIHADRALALGANEFLAKPVSARILVETVNGLLVWRELAGGEEGEPSAISPDE